MEVKLISSPNNLKEIIYTSARTCYSKQEPIEIFKESFNDCLGCPQEDDFCCDGDVGNCTKVRDKNNKIIKLILKVIGSGHLSVLRHINFTFTVSGISRACANQLERHTIGWAFSQQSLRYVEFDFENMEKTEEYISKYYVVPDFIYTEQEEEFISTCYDSFVNYRALIDKGVKAEDARGVLGLNFKTNLVVTCNLQALMHFCNLRLCTNSQKEIQLLAKAMKDEVVKIEPWLKGYLVSKCEVDGFCEEFKCCGRKPKKEFMTFTEPEPKEENIE